MAIRFQFDAEQPHQRGAIHAVVDALASVGDRRGGHARSGRAIVSHGEPLDLGRVLLDVQRVQARQGLALSRDGEGAELTVEMETGTGKTYAYLRLMRELYARYGLSRFIVVVPSLAIRCGVLAQIEALAEHFRGLYPDQRVEASLVDAQSPGGVRRFARDSGLQILVMNIDAFNKGRGNLGHRPADALGGETPVGLCAATRPVVVLDEPQSMEGPRARAALAELQALVTLRWSATHRRAPHCVYRLDPVRAFALGLVKRVDVAAVTAEGGAEAAVTVLQTRATKRGVSAKLAVAGPAGPVALTVRGQGEDLFALSGGVEACRGLVVRAVDHGAGAVDFESGLRLTVGGDATARAAVWRAQLEETIQCHLERELACRRLLPAGERMKVLSLIFLDRVDDYAVEDGSVRRDFCRAWEAARADERFAALELPRAERVHAGYFARRRGEAIDSTGKSREDDEAFALIMADKTRLLSPEEPVRFVFSHSALREGWDNPNVFQICTLRRTRSELKKRQELGRGMRLPVLASGLRTRDPDLARLTVIANESYEAFARDLQREVAADTGVEFSQCITERRARERCALRPGWNDDPWFLEMWRRVAKPLRFVPALDGAVLRHRGTELLRALALPEPTRAVRITRGELTGGGAVAGASERRVFDGAEPAGGPVPDPLRSLQGETGLSRGTLAAMLVGSGATAALVRAPAALLEGAAKALRGLVAEESARRGHLEVCGEPLAPEVLVHRPLAAGACGEVAATRSVYTTLPAGDPAERDWLARVDADPRTRSIFRWPGWLNVPSPMGALAPGWLVARERAAGGFELALVAESPDKPWRSDVLASLAAALGARLELRGPGPRPESGRHLRGRV